MIIAKKIRLLPTKEQEILFRKSTGVARWAYNYFLGEQERHYKEYLANNKEGRPYVNEGEVRKFINNTLKPTTHGWLKEVGSNVMKQAVKDADAAFKRYFKGLAEKPRFKKRGRESESFYVNYESLVRKNHGFHGERIGYVRTSEPLPKLPKGEKYSNPRVSSDGKYWYISVGYEVSEINVEKSEVSLGIDLGVKNLAICSDGKVYKNINKSKEVRRLKKKLKREQRSSSRMLLENIASYYKDNKGYNHPVWKRPLKECKNFQKQQKAIKLVNRRINGIRTNYMHQVTSEIVKTKPSRIVLENLNIKGMMKNRHLSKTISEQKLYEFKRQVLYKSARLGISVVEADRWFPSSKKCSCCGNIKHDLKLKDRVYVCDVCGLVIDRDFNASINLSEYNLTHNQSQD